MDYYYETGMMQKCISDVCEEYKQAHDDGSDLDMLIRSIVTSFTARLRCEISYQGFHGMLLSEEQIWEKVQDREVAKMLDEEAEVYDHGERLAAKDTGFGDSLVDAFKKGLEGKE